MGAGSVLWSSVALPQTWCSTGHVPQGFGAIFVRVPLGDACTVKTRI